MTRDLRYYTDGSCNLATGEGGCAVVLNDQVIWMGFERPPTTSNRMEGMAIIAALKHADGRPCLIFTDSQLWVNILTKWAPKWERLGWQRPGKNKTIANLDLVK